MRDAIITEYVELCERFAAADLVDEGTVLELADEDAEQAFYARLDQLWYVEMSFDERDEAVERMVPKARAWHDARRVVDP
jgi:hypothetical protein